MPIFLRTPTGVKSSQERRRSKGKPLAKNPKKNQRLNMTGTRLDDAGMQDKGTILKLVQKSLECFILQNPINCSDWLYSGVIYLSFFIFSAFRTLQTRCKIGK